MPISYNHKVIFIHIPKCAGTSVESILFNASNAFDSVTKELHFYTETLTPTKLASLPLEKFPDEEYRICASKNKQHYTYRELTKILSQGILDTYEKISIVRNPYDRLVSEYHFCEGSVKIHKDFNDFVKTALNLEKYKRNWLYDGHLETQTSYLINENSNFNSIDKIFKFENLNECFEYLNLLTGIDQKPHARRSNNRGSYEEYYTSELKEIVYNFYKEDFINFNY
jgi:hypothetical protein